MDVKKEQGLKKNSNDNNNNNNNNTHFSGFELRHFTDFLRTTFDFQGLPARNVNHRFVHKCTLPVQGCTLAEPVSPWRLTFVLGRLENLCFFIEIICWAH